MVLTAVVLAWGLTEFTPQSESPTNAALKAALVLSGSTTPIVGPLLTRLLSPQRN